MFLTTFYGTILWYVSNPYLQKQTFNLAEKSQFCEFTLPANNFIENRLEEIYPSVDFL